MSLRHIHPLISVSFCDCLEVSLAFGLTYTGVVYCCRSVGEAHINPGVTVAMLTTRRISFARGALYLVGQLLGSVLGAALAWTIRTQPKLQQQQQQQQILASSS